MRKLIIFLAILFMASSAIAANLLSRTEDTSPTSDDMMYCVNDPGGTPADRKCTVGNVAKGMTVTNMVSACTDAQVLGGDGASGVECQADVDTTCDGGSCTITNAGTAAALEANPAAATAGSCITDIAANGDVEGEVDVWTEAENTAAGYIANVSEDATPQLGGELDAQGNNIIDLGDITFQTGANGGTLRTGSSAADKFVLQAYDVDGGVYVDVMEVDANNDVTVSFLDGALEEADIGDLAHTADEVGTLTTGDLCVNDGSSVNCTVNTIAELETALDAEDILTATEGDAAYQPLDSELTTLSGLTETTGNVIISVASEWASVAQPVIDLTNATNTPETVPGADHIDALTEIAQGIKTAANDTSSLVVGTAGSNTEIAMWNTDGTLTDNNVILGTMTDGKLCGYTSAGTVIDCNNDPSALGADAVGTAELDDDANSPVAGYAVIVEAGAASFDYLDLSGVYQPLDSELTTLAGLTETNGNVIFAAGGAWTSDATPAIDCTDCVNVPAGSSHSGTVTWGGTAILESGIAFQFGDGTDATVTHTYANTGTNVDIAYSTGAMAVTGDLTATNLSGTNTGDDPGTDDQTIDVFTFSTPNISLSLESDAEATKTLDISSLVLPNISQITDITATASEINTPLDGALVALTEFRELETIDATTISANQWAALGGIAETLTSTELNLLDGITVLSGSNTGDNDEVGTLTTGDLCINDGSSVNCTVNTEAELETALDATNILTATEGDAAYLNDDGDTGTGAYDFGGATDFEIPQNQTTNAAGEITVDTTTDQFRYYGGAQRVLHYENENCMGLYNATDVGTVNNYMLLVAPANITVTGVSCAISGTSATVNFQDDADTAIEDAFACDATSTYTWDETIAGTATLNKGEGIEIDVTATNGDVTNLMACVRYTRNAD